MTFEIDIVTEEETIDQAVESINKLGEGIKVIKVVPEGNGSGWPTVIIEAPKSAIPTLEKWYGSEVE